MGRPRSSAGGRQAAAGSKRKKDDFFEDNDDDNDEFFVQGEAGAPSESEDDAPEVEETAEEKRLRLGA